MNSEAVYEIYIDVLYGNYVVMDYLILTLTGIFLKRSATRLRKILTSMLCAGIGLVCMLSSLLPEAVCAILGFGVCEILALMMTYRLKAGNGLLSGVICMYFLTFLYGGCFSFLESRIPYLKQHGYTMLSVTVCGCICFELIRAIYGRLKTNGEKRAALYRVQFVWNETEYSCIGLYDTGNRLYEPLCKRPVCIVEERVLSPMKEQMEAAIPYHSVGCKSGMLYGVYVDAFRISPAETASSFHKDHTGSLSRVLLAIYPGTLSAKHEYEMILHPDLFGQETETGEADNRHETEKGRKEISI